LEIQSIVVHEEVPKEEAAAKLVRALKKRHGDRHLAVWHCQKPKKRTQGDGVSRRSWPPPAEGWLTVPFLQHACDTVIRDQERMRLCLEPRKDGHSVEMPGKTGRHQWCKEPRHETAATSEEGEDNRQRHQRTKQETWAMSGKREDIRGPRTNSRVGDHEASRRDFH
jgi:hypothetical protein